MPKIVDKDAVKAQILSAALSVYSQKGVHSASMSDVAKAADMGKGTLYHYFASKEALALGLVEAHFSGLKAALDAQPLATTRDVFLDQLDAMLDLPPEAEHMTRVMIEVFSPSFGSGAIREYAARFFEDVSVGIAARMKALELGREHALSADPKALARFLVCMLDGMSLHFSLFHMPGEARSAMRMVWRTMIEKALD
ncbi:TetR/AcrR family transcriptional regulator [Woodsholea maritima]|uniref:TetR/AcrR family transcriptional regulator n=1 Tax=Woodsholea maritima TaxID=240237 RepID=UPI0003827B94|nr:TetR/AcrR family transcriptional regulator [Woodsholea maritima]